MRGIAPVIATILMLLIVIAIIGFAYTFFSALVGTAGEQTEEQMKATISQMSKGIWIDSASGTSIVVRNLGTESINTTSEVTVTPNDCASWSTEMIASGSTSTCTLAASCSGTRVTAAGPSNTVSKDCS